MDGTAGIDGLPVQAKLLRSQPNANTNVTRETTTRWCTHPASNHDRSHLRQRESMHLLPHPQEKTNPTTATHPTLDACRGPKTRHALHWKPSEHDVAVDSTASISTSSPPHQPPALLRCNPPLLTHTSPTFTANPLGQRQRQRHPHHTRHTLATLATAVSRRRRHLHLLRRHQRLPACENATLGTAARGEQAATEAEEAKPPAPQCPAPRRSITGRTSLYSRCVPQYGMRRHAVGASSKLDSARAAGAGEGVLMFHDRHPPARRMVRRCTVTEAE